MTYEFYQAILIWTGLRKVVYMASTGNKPAVRISNSFVAVATLPIKDQIIYRDSMMKGFGLRVTKGGSKTFVVEKRIGGKVRRIKIGRYPEINAERARKEAQKIMGSIACGEDPISDRYKQKARLITLEEVFREYEVMRQLKPNTLRDYNYAVEHAFVDWADKPLADITGAMVVERYVKLSAKGKTTASRHMRFLRAIFNFAISRYVDDEGDSFLTRNPVTRLTAIKAWHRPKRRNTYISNSNLKPWFVAMNELASDAEDETFGDVARDYLLFLLLTGLRREEAARLEWKTVDLATAQFSITDTKNHNDHSMPLSDYLVVLLERRRREKNHGYVFQGKGPKGHIVNVYKHMDRVKALSDVEFCLHDLRRTFITAADALDLSAYVLKRLVNHSLSNDLTGGYIVSGVERLRRPMQSITNYLLHQCGERATTMQLPELVTFDSQYNRYAGQ